MVYFHLFSKSISLNIQKCATSKLHGRKEEKNADMIVLLRYAYVAIAIAIAIARCYYTLFGILISLCLEPSPYVNIKSGSIFFISYFSVLFSFI